MVDNFVYDNLIVWGWINEKDYWCRLIVDSNIKYGLI